MSASCEKVGGGRILRDPADAGGGSQSCSACWAGEEAADGGGAAGGRGEAHHRSARPGLCGEDDGRRILCLPRRRRRSDGGEPGGGRGGQPVSHGRTRSASAPPDGLEVLVHVGIDTVKLQGRGFEALVAQGDRVAAGQPLLRVDLASIQGDVPSLATPVLLTNLDDKRTWRLDRQGPVEAGDTGGDGGVARKERRIFCWRPALLCFRRQPVLICRPGRGWGRAPRRWMRQRVSPAGHEVQRILVGRRGSGSSPQLDGDGCPLGWLGREEARRRTRACQRVAAW